MIVRPKCLCVASTGKPVPRKKQRTSTLSRTRYPSTGLQNVPPPPKSNAAVTWRVLVLPRRAERPLKVTMDRYGSGVAALIAPPDRLKEGSDGRATVVTVTYPSAQ